MDPIDLIREGKIKRYFRAKRKLNYPHLVSHITQRAAGKDSLFLEYEDYRYLLWLMKEISQDYSLKIFGFCLLPNHLHLLLSPQNKNLADAMRDLFAGYARRFNKKYERKGHLFGGPYRQAICLDDSYLLAASIYIHLNPVKAGLCKDPLDYRWSSLRLFCDNKAPQSFVDSDFILGMLSDEASKSKKMYLEFIKKSGQIKVHNILEHQHAVKSFRNSLSSMFSSIFQMAKRSKLVACKSGIDLLSIEELNRLTEEVKRNSNSRKPATLKAKKYLIEQLISRGYTRREIAEKLGVSRKTIYNIRNCLE